jgi:NAD(P)H-hydrate epimerase
MTGAVILASLSALKSGCGLVTLGVPEGLNDICESSATEVITRPLPQVKSARALATRATGEASRLCGDAAACVVGCGGGRHHETQELFTRLLERNETPLILDADGLYPFGADPDRLVRHRAPLCITPHAGELARLLHLETEEVQADRIGSALRAARHFDCVCVLKGALTVVATITGQVYLNPTGNSGMGTAGSGDVRFWPRACRCSVPLRRACSSMVSRVTLRPKCRASAGFWRPISWPNYPTRCSISRRVPRIPVTDHIPPDNSP